MFTQKLTTVDRFMQYVTPEPNSGCWLWLGVVNRFGYGQFGYGARKGKKLSQGQRSVRAHRFSYELFVGPIPEGMDIDHLCRVRCCVNPRHLEAVTHKENVNRGMAAEVNTARNRAKTHCPRGHEYTPENTRVIGGGRKCLACRPIYESQRVRKRVNGALCTIRPDGTVKPLGPVGRPRLPEGDPRLVRGAKRVEIPCLPNFDRSSTVLPPH
jgi:HNH endonuclease